MPGLQPASADDGRRGGGARRRERRERVRPGDGDGRHRTGRGLQPDSQAEAIRILREYGPTSVRAGIPSGVPVAAKPGGLDGVRTEVAWVDLKGRPYLLCVMTSFLADDRAGGKAITDISQRPYQYFSRLARAGVEGRLLTP